MDDNYLYKQIAEKMRQQILSGELKPGDRLPSLRDLASQWSCTIGTVQRAYKELALQGLITSRSGQGTKVVEYVQRPDETPMRRAMLIHRAEAFLLEALTAGYALPEVDQAVQQAMDRWRIVEKMENFGEAKTLRFVGSHDLVITWLASHFIEIAPGYAMQLNFTGSLGGLIALAEDKAEIAGSHLWDEETGTYNVPFVRRLLPGKRTAVIALADRRLGLILPPGNPAGIQKIADLARPGLRFTNRQSGSGTRIWLDAALNREGIDHRRIKGYDDENITHTAVAQVVAEGKVDAGIGLEAAAISYGLDFIFLTNERYDLIALAEVMETEPLMVLVEWLKQPATRALIEGLGGYDASLSGEIEWVG
jgi:molybdate-binding protein/DNA-binding transcriptional regulator YhcF (GntR family)